MGKNQEEVNTELRAAVKSRDIEKVRRLLRKKADVNARDNLGDTPLHFATKASHTEMAELLKAHGGIE